MKKIVILGTGGNCIDILDTINEINQVKKQYDCIGFLDDSPQQYGKSYFGVKVIGTLTQANLFEDAFFVNGIGSSNNFKKKESIIKKTGLALQRFETIIHPTASVSKFSKLGFGCVILQQVTIASNVTLGNHVIILPNSIISHDGVIGDYTCITGGVCISGGVRIGKSCYIGTNSAIRNNITIGNHCLIGMGSNVLSDVDADSVVFGNPATLQRKT
ncbi:MAG: acetyltransferase [Bacteroidia bacterium]|nr:acetyltransferase [Bacteroidia bacterium]